MGDDLCLVGHQRHNSWELLSRNETVTSELYCKQLERLADNLKGKQDRVYFLHDNARPHTSNVTNEKLQTLGWQMVPHLAYSSDLAPSDYHLFRSMAHFVDESKFEDEDEVESAVSGYFESLSLEFFQKGIYSLPERWRQVVLNNGAYIE